MTAGTAPSRVVRHPYVPVLSRLPTVSPQRFRTISYVALALLTVIVLTGAAVRLTASGLGCPDWPRCHGRVVPPLGFNTFVEYGNRVFSALIGFVALGTWIAALRRSPRRRDLVWIAALLPLGCLAQGIVGGFTVMNHLAPGFVMAHFLLSMAILIAAVWLVAAARRPDGAPSPATADRWTVYLVRLCAVLGGVTIVLGTLATAAGPHPGDHGGEVIHRLDFKGADTLVWVIHRHAIVATLLGIGVILAWFLARLRTRNTHLVETLTVCGILMAGQGLVGSVQYGLRLPADMVWVHVALASITWIALLWAAFAAGRVSDAAAPAGPRPAGEDADRFGPEHLARPIAR